MKNCTNCKYRENMCKWPCDDCVKGDKWEEKLSTYADSIRAMTDEELADFMILFSDYVPNPDGRRRKDCWLDWLKQEVENG